MSEWATRYLRLLGLSSLEFTAPSLDGLGRLCRAQVTRVPFENVTAILRRAGAGVATPVPALDTNAMLDAWEAGAGGGVCVDVTPTFSRLLIGLGYAARPTLAQISFPGSHQASIVTLDGGEYLVDVANGAPFFEPIPLDRETIVTRCGLVWRFRRETPEVFVQDRSINGDWQPFCRYSVAFADASDVEAAYQRHHRVGESWVVENLTLVRCTDDEVVRLRDDQLACYSASGTLSERVAESDLARIAADIFGVAALPVDAALHALRSA